MWRFYKSLRGKDGAANGVARRSGARIVMVWIERGLLVSGLSLVIVYGAARVEGWLASRLALKRFAAVQASEFSTDQEAESRASDKDDNSSLRLELPNVDFSLWDKERVTAYKQRAEKQLRTPLAVLRIPKIHLEAPLLDGTDDFTLNHAVGRIAGTPHPGEPGNIGIAGHRDGFFRGLKDVSVGDEIELKTLQGTATYVVDRIQIVSPHQVEVLRPTSVPATRSITSEVHRNATSSRLLSQQRKTVTLRIRSSLRRQLLRTQQGEIK
jgi:sortase A